MINGMHIVESRRSLDRGQVVAFDGLGFVLVAWFGGSEEWVNKQDVRLVTSMTMRD